MHEREPDDATHPDTPLHGRPGADVRADRVTAQGLHPIRPAPPGHEAPLVRALAADVTCSVLTTRRAYEDLEREGLISTRQGVGSVVAQIPDEEIRTHRREPVKAALEEAVRAGRRAGLTEEELRHIIEETLQSGETDVYRGGST